ncbi:MAG: hypothetical protein V4555_21060 [Acidobacteriota bacterium]
MSTRLSIEQPSQEATTFRKALFAVLLGVISFAAAASIIHLCIRSPLNLYAAVRSEKLAAFAPWQGRATSAIFGSSHIHNGFDPRSFDQTLAATPLATTTFNLGVEGGSQSEQRVLALNFLKTLRPQPHQACFVFLELNAGANFTNNHLVHPRTIDIYDWRTLRFIHQLSPRSLGTQRALGRTSFGIVGSLLYYTNVGMLANRIFTPPLDQQMLTAETIQDRRGLYTPDQPAATAAVFQLFADAGHAMTPAPEPLLPGNYALLSELQRDSPIRGVHFIYVVSPRIDNLSSYPQYPAEITVDGVTTPILSMARADLYPDLFPPAEWIDGAHLSAAGAGVLGRDLARQLLDYYQQHPQPMDCGG